MDKYKLVVFGDVWDVYQAANKDLIENPRITYIPTFRPAGMLGQLQRLQFNPRLNRVVPIPGKQHWNPWYLRMLDKSQQRICFLLQEHWLRMESGIRLLPYLRSHYPQARIICFFQDLLHTIVDHYQQRPIDVDYVKRYADLCISYDADDAARHGMAYHPSVFSPVNTDEAERQEPASDLFFLGRDKGRLPQLIRICQTAVSRGLRPQVLMIEVPENQRVACEGITYLDANIPYAENLRLASRSRCIIELLQQQACSATFRTWEAIALNRRLLTNNLAVRKSSFFDARYISVFHDENDIDWDDLATPPAFPDGVNPYQELIRPEALIRFIEQRLNIEIDR